MAAEEHTEIERKYDVAADVAVPALDSLPGVDQVAAAQEVRLAATYFDTPGLALARAGMTLRRRTGGEDAGWHLKLPLSKDHRTEVRLPLGDDDDVPVELLSRVRAVVRDRPVAPVATLRNRRVLRLLQDADGATLAEFCDDNVTAELPDEATAERWREWEVELVDGEAPLLGEAHTLLVRSGGRPAVRSSKLARALGTRLPVVQRPSKKQLRKGSTGQLLTAYLEKHLTRLEQEDLRLRTGDVEGVHQMRIAARRLRSALTTYRDVLRPGAADGLREELKWLGGVLAEARDAQVLGERLGRLVRTQPATLVLGPVAQRLTDEMGGRFRSGRADADRALDSERYFRLLDRLEAFVAEPPLSDAARGRAAAQLPWLLQLDLDRVRKRDRAVARATTADERDRALHDVRKAAKRLRYAAETARPVFGKRAKRLSGVATSIQQVLGEHQDTVVARATLREIGVRAHLDGENAFTFGRLHALEEARAADLEREYPALLERLPRRRLGSWLDH